jgi:hypothetical protein
MTAQSIPTGTDNTDHARYIAPPVAPRVNPDDVAYYHDPDAATNILTAAGELRRYIDDFNNDVHQLHLTNPEHRAWVRKYVANIITALDGVENYDDETIRLTLAHQEKH